MGVAFADLQFGRPVLKKEIQAVSQNKNKGEEEGGGGGERGRERERERSLL